MKTAVCFISILLSLLLPALGQQYPDLQQLVESGRLSEALALVGSHLQKSPRHPELLYWKAVIEWKSDQPDRAIETLLGLLKKDQARPPHLLLLGSIYDSRGQWADAANVYRLALAQIPGPEVALKWAAAEFRNRRYEEVIRVLEPFAAQVGAGAEIHHLLGLALFGKRDFVPARAQFEKAITLAPADASLHYDYGLSLTQEGQLKMAAEHFRQAVRLKPDWPEAYLYLGRVLHDLNLGDDAMAAFQKAQSLQAGLPLLHYHMGLLHKGRGEDDEAVAEFQREIALQTRYAPAYYHLADLLHNRNQLVESRRLIEQACLLDDLNSEYHLLAAKIEMDAERFQEADQHVAAALKAAPDSAPAHYLRGRLYQIQGDPERARSAFQKARQLADQKSRRTGIP